MSLNVTIPDTFNGPLGLLHSLIVRDEIDIHDIPIARLTASYCEEIEKMEVINIDEGAEFLDLASRLKDIKLRMLLPPEETPEGEEDEDGDDAYDPRSDLVRSLLEYRRFKDASRLLAELADEQSRRYPRVAPRLRFVENAPEDDGDAPDGSGLYLAMQTMLDRMVSAPDTIESHEIPISTRIDQIREVLSRRERTRFSLLLSSKNVTRREMVGFFVAILELVRRGLVVARQTDNFSDIILERRQQPTRQDARTGRARLRPGACFPDAAALFRRPAGGGKKKAGRAAARPPAALFPKCGRTRSSGKGVAGGADRRPPASLFSTFRRPGSAR